MSNGLPDYSVTDVSGHVDTRVNDNRRISPVGTCVHTTSGANSLAWLMGGSATAGNPASADWLIGRIGERYKITPAGRYAYHAGQSKVAYNNRLYQGDEVSQLLIGIELEQQGDELVTWQQVDALAQTIVELGLANAWRWPYYLKGHYDIARPVGRRSDPQGLDWGALMGRLYVRAQAASVGGLQV